MSGHGNSTDIVGDVIATRASVSKDEPFVKRGSIASIISQPHRGSQTIKPISVTSSDNNVDYAAPTDEEYQSLRKVAGSLPLVAYTFCLIEFAERASYYGAKTVFSNFVQFPLPAGGNGAGAPPKNTQETAGALGMGLQASSGLVLLFTFLAYVIPIFGGWLADVKTGRYKAIIIGVLICGVAHLVQIFGAIPSVLQRGRANAAPPFIIGLLLLALGAGIFKPNVSPLILDQNRHQQAYIRVLESGERVVVDPEATVSRIMLLFYGFINVGAFFMVATTYSEKYVGYWLAFTLAGSIYFLLPILLAVMYKRTYKRPASGTSDLHNALKIISYALRRNKFRFWRKDFWDAASPSILETRGINVDWTDRTVRDLRRTLSAVEVFCYFPIYYLNDGGFGSVPNNQGAAMVTNGAPNDLLNNINPLAIIIATPLLGYVVYPFLRKWNINPGRITRITIGFGFAMLSNLSGALIQWRIYKTSPCGYYASTCDQVSPINIWWQVTTNVFAALSECFCNVTAYELAYARSPPSMRGLVVASFLFMNALSSALGEILIPITKDPYLIWLWGAPVVALALQTIVFIWRFRSINKDEFMTFGEDEEDADVDSTVVNSVDEKIDEKDLEVGKAV